MVAGRPDGVLPVEPQRFLQRVGAAIRPGTGLALGEPFAVTELNDPAQMIPPRTVQLGMAVSHDRLIVPVAAASGNIWVLDGMNR